MLRVLRVLATVIFLALALIGLIHATVPDQIVWALRDLALALFIGSFIIPPVVA